MEHHFLSNEIKYDGTQLRSHFIFGQTGVLGDAICAFTGPADVPLKNMVDLADVAAKENIYSTSMLHFIVEHFDADLTSTILRQRLLAAIAAEELKKHDGCKGVERRGDDLYDGDRKLSVSIATASPVSCLIHFAINVKSDKTPVLTKGLADYDIDPAKFADFVMQRYASEMNSVKTARCKVRAVE
jgi:hypothetical protein